jgi:hypothetical protein
MGEGSEEELRREGSCFLNSNRIFMQQEIVNYYKMRVGNVRWKKISPPAWLLLYLVILTGSMFIVSLVYQL